MAIIRKIIRNSLFAKQLEIRCNPYVCFPHNQNPRSHNPLKHQSVIRRAGKEGAKEKINILGVEEKSRRTFIFTEKGL